MNKREFVAGGMAAVVAAPALARSVDPVDGEAPLRALLTRTQRLPDLAARPGAEVFDAYIGERFAVVGGAGTGEHLVVATVERVARSTATEQFNVAFRVEARSGTSDAPDGLRVLQHATGQRLALHLQGAPGGYTARFNLLA